MLRAIRVRKGWRQSDLAAKARVSATLVARAERGDLASIPMGKVRRVTETLGARFDAIIRWQGADLGKLLDVRHAGMHEAMAALLSSLDGWLFEPEVSFSAYGERGIIDVLAWHPGRRTLLVIELKTELVEVSGLIGSMDRRRRLAWRIARERGWDPGRCEHVGPHRGEPDEPSGRGGAQRRSPSQDAGRRSRDAWVAPGSLWTRRRPRFPAISACHGAWATCCTDQARRQPERTLGSCVSVARVHRNRPPTLAPVRRSVTR